MPPLRTVVVVNPRSQAGALGARWAGMAQSLRREIGSFEDVVTRRPGDATRLTRDALAAGAERIVAVGGDGTINEVVNGFFDAEGAPVATEASLGIIPFGTGGDFRKTVNLPKDLPGAARVLRQGAERRVDVGRLQFATPSGATAVRMFINIASFGISGLVDQYANSSSKALGGTISFLIATARAGLRYENQRVRLVFDGDESTAVDRTINTVAVANGRFFGGGMHIAPAAELDDGLFDVVILGDFGRAEIALHTHRLYTGTHLDLAKVAHRRARELRATPLGSEPVRLDVDGEAPGNLPATFTLVPRAVTLLVPQ
jgi:YegS/Rv2252/BmrU family lipid kinase